MSHVRPTRNLWLGAAVLAVLGVLAIVSPASANAPRSKAEHAFLVDMIHHHRMAVAMAEMAKEKATHQELKDLSDDIIRTQTSEIDRMRRWLRAWYGGAVDGDGHMDHGEDMEMLEAASGPEFEVLFISMMTVHHTQAIERAKAVRRARLHGKTRQLTRDIIRAQRREIGQLQEWLVAWYAN